MRTVGDVTNDRKLCLHPRLGAIEFYLPVIVEDLLRGVSDGTLYSRNVTESAKSVLSSSIASTGNIMTISAGL